MAVRLDVFVCREEEKLPRLSWSSAPVVQLWGEKPHQSCQLCFGNKLVWNRHPSSLFFITPHLSIPFISTMTHQSPRLLLPSPLPPLPQSSFKPSPLLSSFFPHLSSKISLPELSSSCTFSPSSPPLHFCVIWRCFLLSSSVSTSTKPLS